LRRFAYGQNTKQTNPAFDEDAQFEKSVIRENEPLPSPTLKYPLPTPWFGGYPIDEVYLFIGGVHLLGNLSLTGNKYRLSVSLTGGPQKQLPVIIAITDKSSFINKFIEFKIGDQSVMEKMEKMELVAEFRVIE
jgi:hypothetical protein